MSKQTMATTDLRTVVRGSRYPLEAFLFVQRGLDHTVRKLHGEPDPAGKSSQMDNRHVSGRDLCHGLREYAIQEYGLLARAVLRRWGIYASEDFGHIVFAMVDAGLMHKTDEDTIDDFIGVIDFAEAFTPTLDLSETTGSNT